jgi:hypothetical protein
LISFAVNQNVVCVLFSSANCGHHYIKAQLVMKSMPVKVADESSVPVICKMLRPDVINICTAHCCYECLYYNTTRQSFRILNLTSPMAIAFDAFGYETFRYCKILAEPYTKTNSRIKIVTKQSRNV